MKLLHVPTPRRLLNVFASSRRAPVLHRAEPLLGFEHLSPPPPAAPQPLGRRAVEMALEEGSSRVYVPMAEAEVLDRPRRR